MDFSSWSLSHTILVAFIVVGFVGQIAVSLCRIGQLEKRMAQSEERTEKRDAELLAMFDKRIGGMNQRISSEITGLRSEMNQRLSDIDASIRQLNQNHIDHLTHHQSEK
jgi:uncharacterized protein YicC (UPF0701 family)